MITELLSGPVGTPTSGSRKVPRLGFLGVGWIGLQRLSAIAASGSAEVAAVADPAVGIIDRVTPVAPKAARLASFEELLEQDLDGLVIATPSALHATQALRAIDRGLPVFCQKPLGRNAAEVGHVIAAAKRRDLLLGVDLSYRHVEGIVRIERLLRTQELGRVFAARLVFHNAYGPDKAWFYDRTQAGGGCVIDLGIHLVDLALWLLDSQVTRVESAVFCGGELMEPGDERIEDFAASRLALANGVIVEIDCSWRLHAGQHAVIEATFHGTQGGAAFQNVNGSFVDFRAERLNGTCRAQLADPPDDWSGRAAVAWARKLANGSGFDPEIERQNEVAEVLDAIYGRSEAFSQR